MEFLVYFPVTSRWSTKLHALTTVHVIFYKLYYLFILTIRISRQQNCANRTYQFLKELYSSQFALSYTRTLLGNKRILVCSWPSVIIVSLYSRFSYPGMQSAFFYAALYYHGCPVWLFHIFPYYLLKGSIFGKTLRNKVFWVSLQLASEAFLILTKIQRDIISVNASSHKVPVIVRF